MGILWNVVLVIVLLLLMNQQLLGSRRHEYLGMAFVLFILLHLGYDRGWFKTWFRGKQSAQRLLGTGMNLLLIVALVVTVVTGFLISTTMFSIVKLRGAESIFAHELHQGSAYVSFILMAIHLGVHWNSIWIHMKNRLGFVRRKKSYKWAGNLLMVIIMGYAVYASFLNHMGDRLMMDHMMNFGDSSNYLRYSLDLTAIFAGYAIAAYICKKNYCKVIQ